MPPCRLHKNVEYCNLFNSSHCFMHRKSYSIAWALRAKHSTAQHSTAQHSTAQHSTAQHSTACRHSHAQVPFYCHRCYHGSSVIGHRVSQLQRLQVSLLEKKQNDYTIWHQSNEKPSIILGYPGFSLLPYSRNLS